MRFGPPPRTTSSCLGRATPRWPVRGGGPGRVDGRDRRSAGRSWRAGVDPVVEQLTSRRRGAPPRPLRRCWAGSARRASESALRLEFQRIGQMLFQKAVPLSFAPRTRRSPPTVARRTTGRCARRAPTISSMLMPSVSPRRRSASRSGVRPPQRGADRVLVVASPRPGMWHLRSSLERPISFSHSAFCSNFGEGPADRHHLADRLHRGSWRTLGAGEFLEGEDAGYVVATWSMVGSNEAIAARPVILISSSRVRPTASFAATLAIEGAGRLRRARLERDPSRLHVDDHRARRPGWSANCDIRAHRCRRRSRATPR